MLESPPDHCCRAAAAVRGGIGAHGSGGASLDRRMRQMLHRNDHNPASDPRRRAYHESDNSLQGASAMDRPSPVVSATLRALCGESDPHVAAPALGDPRFACVLTLAPGVDPVIRALGALAGEVLELIAPAVRDSPALAAAVESLIGTGAERYILEPWVDIAPTGWGSAHAAALIDAVRRNRCAPWTAAALIGPSSDAAVLLCKTWETSCAIRCWGQATPNEPTAWMDTLEPAQRDRLMETLRAEPSIAVTCMPWLPAACAADVVDHIGSESLFLALAAYVNASLSLIHI